jgi:hypothetical protein
LGRKPQYLRRFKEWGLSKNITSEAWKVVEHRLRKRRLEGKETEVLLNGIIVDKKRLKKEISRHVPLSVTYTQGKAQEPCTNATNSRGKSRVLKRPGVYKSLFQRHMQKKEPYRPRKARNCLRLLPTQLPRGFQYRGMRNLHLRQFSPSKPLIAFCLTLLKTKDRTLSRD